MQVDCDGSPIHPRQRPRDVALAARHVCAVLPREVHGALQQLERGRGGGGGVVVVHAAAVRAAAGVATVDGRGDELEMATRSATVTHIILAG